MNQLSHGILCPPPKRAMLLMRRKRFERSSKNTLTMRDVSSASGGVLALICNRNRVILFQTNIKHITFYLNQDFI